MSPEQKEKIDALLTGFKELDLDRLNQASEVVFEEDGACGGCVGAWSAVFLGLPKYQPWDKDRCSFWRFEHGIDALMELFGLRSIDLEGLLADCGAGTCDPFGPRHWTNPPYLVLHEAVKRRFDYDFIGSPTVLEA